MQNPNNPRSQSEDLDAATNDKVEGKQNLQTEDCSHNPEAIQTGPPTDSAYSSATHEKFEHAQNARAEDHTQSTEDVRLRPPTDEDYSSSSGRSSYAESIFSVQSDASSSSQYSNEYILSATEEFVSLLLNDDTLGPLFATAVERKGIGPERFVNNLRRLLKLYGKNLRNEAQEHLQVLAAQLVQSRARLISYSVRKFYDPVYEMTTQDWIQPSNISQQKLDHFLQHGGVATEVDSADSDNDNINQEQELTTLQGVKAFMLAGTAWRDFQNRLRNFVEAPYNDQEHYNAFREISNDLLSVLKEDGTYEILITIRWELSEYVESELHRCWDIRPVLTLSGNMRAAYAAICEDYVNHFWPDFGLTLLKSVVAVMSRDNTSGKLRICKCIFNF